MSLRFRIVAAIVLVLVSGSALGLALAGWQARQWLRGELVSAQASGELAVRRAYGEMPRAPEPDLGALVATFDGDRHLQARLIGADGRVIRASRLAPVAAPPAWFAALLHPRVASASLVGPGGETVELAPVYTNDAAAVWPEFLDLSLVLALSCLGGAALVWVLVGQALKPLSSIGEVLPRIGGGDYAVRSAEQGPPELIGLARGVNAMAGQLAAMRARNQALEDQLLTLQDEERADIARDLHDEIGPHLFAANVDATMSLSLMAAGRHDEASAQVRSIQSAIGHMQRLVRDILGRLRPIRLVELGLSAAILDLIAFWRGRRPEVVFEAGLLDDEDGLSESLQETVYRLVQESLANAVRHGAPTRIAVSLKRTARELRVEVRNDGAAASAAAATPGFGLTGMTERVAAAGGVMAAGPLAEGGWSVRAALPLAAGAAEERAA